LSIHDAAQFIGAVAITAKSKKPFTQDGAKYVEFTETMS